MNKDIFIFEIIFAFSILVTGVTMFMIFNKVKKINFDFVDSIAKKKHFSFNNSGSNITLDLKRFFYAYWVYYKHEGLNLILFLHLVSYFIAFLIGILYLS